MGWNREWCLHRPPDLSSASSDLNHLTLRLIASRPCPVDHLCQFASKSVHSFSKYHVHKFGNRRTNGRTDKLRTAATQAWHRQQDNYRHSHMWHDATVKMKKNAKTKTTFSKLHYIIIIIYAFIMHTHSVVILNHALAVARWVAW